MPSLERNIERIVESRIAKARKDIIRIVRKQQEARHAARSTLTQPPKKKSVRVLTMEALARGAKSRDTIYHWFFKRNGTDENVRASLKELGLSAIPHTASQLRLIRSKLLKRTSNPAKRERIRDAAAEVLQAQRLANNVNINLHVLARARIIKKEMARGGRFSLVTA